MRTYFHMPRAFAVHCLSKPPTHPPQDAIDPGMHRLPLSTVGLIARCLVYFWPFGSLATIRSRRSNCSVEHPQDLGARATTAMDPGLTPPDALQAPNCLDYWLGSAPTVVSGLGLWPFGGHDQCHCQPTDRASTTKDPSRWWQPRLPLGFVKLHRLKATGSRQIR